MFSVVRMAKDLCRKLFTPAPARPYRHYRPSLEALEGRYCLDAWRWVSNLNLGGTAAWSNAVGKNWEHQDPQTQQWNLAPANTYPGLPGTLDDLYFTNALARDATLDLPIAHLRKLMIDGWGFGRTLTLNHDLTVNGVGGGGAFALAGNVPTIELAANITLTLSDVPTATWTDGWISGGLGFHVLGSALLVSDEPGGLGTELVIRESINRNAGSVTLSNMTANLELMGASTGIRVGAGGTLHLGQVITDNTEASNRGGIVFGPGLTLARTVLVEVGGALRRDAFNAPANQLTPYVVIQGAVHNEGGIVEATNGGWLNINGQDANGYSYWHCCDETAVLRVGRDSKITAAGKFQIDTGEVMFQSGGLWNEYVLTSAAGLFFGNQANTFLTMEQGTPGTVKVLGSITLAANTTTKMNYDGTAGTADMIHVENGVLSLAGTLFLQSAPDRQKLNQPKDFFKATGGGSNIIGLFGLIEGNLMIQYSGQIIILDQVKYYMVTMQ